MYLQACWSVRWNFRSLNGRLHVSPSGSAIIIYMYIVLVLRSRSLTTLVWFGLNPKTFNGCQEIFSRRSNEYSKRWSVQDSVDETSGRSRKTTTISRLHLYYNNGMTFSILPHSDVDENSVYRPSKRVLDEFVFAAVFRRKSPSIVEFFLFSENGNSITINSSPLSGRITIEVSRSAPEGTEHDDKIDVDETWFQQNLSHIPNDKITWPDRLNSLCRRQPWMASERTVNLTHASWLLFMGYMIEVTSLREQTSNNWRTQWGIEQRQSERIHFGRRPADYAKVDIVINFSLLNRNKILILILINVGRFLRHGIINL